MNLDPGEVREAFRSGPHDVLDIGHSKIAHWHFGSGPELVFVHGWPVHSATFRDLVPQLAARYSCHLFDLPGAGYTTSSPDAPIGLREHGDTVRLVVDALGLSRFAYVAHDSGAVAARIAAQDDARVAGLAFGNSEVPGHVSLLLEAYVKSMKLPGALHIMKGLMRLRSFRRSALGFGSCFEDPSSSDGEFFEIFVRPMLESDDVLRGQLRLLYGFDPKVVTGLRDVHARISAPALLVWGTDDPFFPLAKAKAMLNQFPGGAELREIPRARLFCHEDHAPEFLAHIEPFLARCFRSRAIAAA